MINRSTIHPDQHAKFPPHPSDSALHQFADLTFLDVCCSVEEATAAFLRNNSNPGIPDDIPTNCNFEKGLYEEIHSVGWEGPHPASAESNCDQWQSETEEEDDEESSCWGDYPMEEEEDEERDKNTGESDEQGTESAAP